MSRLSLFFLGPPRIERDGAPVKLETRKAMALLAYLVVKGSSQRRDALIDLLWPDSNSEHAHADLRRTLSDLRTSLAGDWLVTDRDTIGLNPNADIWSDISQFHTFIAVRISHGHPLSAVCGDCLPLLAEAVALPHGDFLSGFSLRDSPDFDDWQFLQAEASRRELSNALEMLVQGLSSQGQFDQALTYTRQWLALDRLNEAAHAHLMRLYAWLGQRPAALRQYNECARLLKAELGISPQPSLTAMYEAIRDGRLPRPPSAAAPAPSSSRTVPATEPATVTVEEKRIVTALYADAGATFQGTSDVAAEDEAALIRRFVAAAQATVAHYGGQVVRSVGDGILAVCGLAQTHESDPELAIRSALALRGEAAKMGLMVTVGISTGEVYTAATDALEGSPPSPLGRAVDTAIRLAGRAQAGQIWVAEATYRLTRHTFTFTRVDRAAATAAVYQVDGLLARPAKERGIEGLRARLTGRDAEMARLKAALEQARQGNGQMVSVIGEAGVGKSRLIAELRNYAGEDGDRLLWLEGRCLELGMATSYAPFLDILHVYFGWTAEGDEHSRQASIAAGLQALTEQGHLATERTEEMAALLCRLLSLPVGDTWDERLRNLSPEYIRYRTFLALRDFFAALSRRQPLVLVFEDLHWADDLSLDVIPLLMDSLSTQSQLLLCAYRPERESSVRRLATMADQKCRDCYSELRLRDLTEQESRQMVASILTIEELPPPLREAILARAQGNPFYIEEMLRSLIDAGVVYRQGEYWRAGSDIGEMVVPESVQAVILSRVDQLDTATKRVLQAAAVIGPLFRRRLLHHITEVQDSLPRILGDLEERALIYQEHSVPEVEYSFKHVLTQQAVYDNILSGRRAGLHQQIAAAIENLWGSDLSDYYEQLAYHYERGDASDKAIGYLFKAGGKAARSYANKAAIAHLTRALDLLKMLPDSPQHARTELDIQLALLFPLVATKMMGATEVHDAASRILQLSRQLEDTTAYFKALGFLWGFHHHRGHPGQAREFALQAMDLAQATGDSRLLVDAHRGMNAVLGAAGDIVGAQAHVDRALALCMSRADRAQFFLMGYQSMIGLLQLASDNLWQLGYADQALERSRQALALAHESANPWDVASALLYSAILHWRCRQIGRVDEDANAVIQIATASAISYDAAWGVLFCGWVLVQQGQVDDGIAQIHLGIDRILALGVTAAKPQMGPILAEAYLQAGQTGEALATLDEALNDLASTGYGLLHKGEMLRLKGEALLRHGAEPAETEECFLQAVEITRGQLAKGWELRAAISLARLWQKQGKRDEAHSLLQNVYAWFTEGFETADLRDAKALLAELRQR